MSSFQLLCTSITESVSQAILYLNQTTDYFNRGLSALGAEKQKLDNLQNQFQTKQQRLKKDQEQVKVLKREIELEMEKLEKQRRAMEEITQKHQREVEEEKEKQQQQQSQTRTTSPNKRKSKSGKSEEDKRPLPRSSGNSIDAHLSDYYFKDFSDAFDLRDKDKNRRDPDRGRLVASIREQYSKNTVPKQDPNQEKHKNVTKIVPDEETNYGNTRIRESTKHHHVEKVVQEVEGQRVQIQVPLKHVTQPKVQQQQQQQQQQRPQQAILRENNSEKQKRKFLSKEDEPVTPSKSPRQPKPEVNFSTLTPQSIRRKSSKSDFRPKFPEFQKQKFPETQRNFPETPKIPESPRNFPETQRDYQTLKIPESPRDFQPQKNPESPRDFQSQKNPESPRDFQSQKFPDTLRDSEILNLNSETWVYPNMEIPGVEDPLVRNLPVMLTKLVDVVSIFEGAVKSVQGTSRGLDRDLWLRSLQDLVSVQKEVYNFFQGRYPEVDSFLTSEFVPAIKNVGISTKTALGGGSFEELEKNLQVMRELPIKLLVLIRRICMNRKSEPVIGDPIVVQLGY